MNLSEQKCLQQAIEYGILDLDQIQDAMLQVRRKEYLALHQYSIWENKAGKWMTHIRDDRGKLVVRKRNTRAELEEFLVEHYMNHESPIFIKDIFELWIDDKLKYGEIQKQSYDRYRSDFDRFFKADKISQKLFKEITESDLDSFIKRTISENKLTHKSYSGLITLLKGIFKYGKSNGYTSLSITSFLGDLQLSKSIFSKRHKDKNSEIFMEDEIMVVTEYLRSNPDIWNLALLLQFQTGMRIGEIAALRAEDIMEDSILVRRTEIKYKNEQGKWNVGVGDMPKTDAGYREIILPPTARWTINKILEFNDEGFLFTNNGKRIRENTFNKRLSRICDELGLLHRTSHKIRKTYGTTLLDGGVNDIVVAEQMGHTDVATTRKLYYFSNKSRSNKVDQISNAIDF